MSYTNRPLNVLKARLADVLETAHKNGIKYTDVTFVDYLVREFSHDEIVTVCDSLNQVAPNSQLVRVLLNAEARG